MKYTLNLIQQHREELRKKRIKKLQMITLGLVCFIICASTFTYVFMQIQTMRLVIEKEKRYCEKIERMYKRYQSVKMIVNKEDIELLNQLQNRRILWTKKLESLARHLPEQYWINKFRYTNKNFTVEGGGFISKKQEQLITLDEYLTKLRADSNYHDIFPITRLTSATRTDDKKKLRINYDFVSHTSGAAVQ